MTEHSSAVEIVLLGPVGVSVPGQLKTDTSKRGRAMLAALALAGRNGLSKMGLRDAVWGPAAECTSASAVAVAVHRLRRWLACATSDEVTVRTTPSGYALDLGAIDTDLNRFRRLVAEAEAASGPVRVRLLTDALACWRGQPLTGLPDEIAERGQARSMERERVAAVVRLAHALLEERAGEQALSALAGIVDLWPLDEGLQAAWIDALAATGREAEALNRFDQLRRRLADTDRKPGPVLTAAFARVLGEQTSSIPLPRAKPAQLPVEPTAFTGRAEALAELDSAYRRRLGSGRPITIVGGPGAGKTALAVHWGHARAGCFPDGQLYADLGGGKAVRGPTTADVLGRFLRALGVGSDAVPTDIAAAAALFRSVLGGRRMLIVLDNAGPDVPSPALLPAAPGCCVVVAGRRRVPGLPVDVELGALNRAEATGLLESLVGNGRISAEAEAASRLVDLCGCMPTAIRFAAVRVRRHASISEVTSWLAQHGTTADLHPRALT